MAVDLGLQKVVGVKYQGEKDPWYLRHWSRQSIESNDAADEEASVSRAQQLEVEQERMDTFWAVFMLDREISSGTGRPVTFRDDDFEFDLPAPTIHPASGWPAPYPTLTRIIHLYGRVSDLGPFWKVDKHCSTLLISGTAGSRGRRLTSLEREPPSRPPVAQGLNLWIARLVPALIPNAQRLRGLGELHRKRQL
ncbi:hypothetical protein BN1723_016265 [Verticillium longisporum]|uniref:Xylanolytic transcriptional activator regulatory domain-containing protein n=1 Tax=Verticillium longisporum TaxID=100787 RepID=A0A0G4NBN2_VERLO|nr:hypothetical protein BN1723_016265 [Verticillium longisporum]